MRPVPSDRAQSAADSNNCSPSQFFLAGFLSFLSPSHPPPPFFFLVFLPQLLSPLSSSVGIGAEQALVEFMLWRQNPRRRLLTSSCHPDDASRVAARRPLSSVIGRFRLGLVFCPNTPMRLSVVPGETLLIFFSCAGRRTSHRQPSRASRADYESWLVAVRTNRPRESDDNVSVFLFPDLSGCL